MLLSLLAARSGFGGIRCRTEGVTCSRAPQQSVKCFRHGCVNSCFVVILICLNFLGRQGLKCLPECMVSDSLDRLELRRRCERPCVTERDKDRGEVEKASALKRLFNLSASWLQIMRKLDIRGYQFTDSNCHNHFHHNLITLSSL